MFKRKITYQDFNDPPNTYTDTFYFNFSKPEVVEFEAYKGAQLSTAIRTLTNAESKQARAEVLRYLILKSYGVKSADGKRFSKSEELSKEFEESNAYAVLYEELATDDKAASDFVNGVMPKDLISGPEFETAKKEAQKQLETEDPRPFSTPPVVVTEAPAIRPPSPPKTVVDIKES